MFCLVFREFLDTEVEFKAQKPQFEMRVTAHTLPH